MNGKITVVGSLNMDLVVTIPKMPILGETILGNGFMTAPGGKGANQAVAVARLGGTVCMVGCVGNDMYGSQLLANLTDNNVDVSHVEIVDDVTTGVAIVAVKDNDNFIIVNPAANSLLTPGMVKKLESLIASSSILVVQLEIPLAAVEMAISIARKHGVKVLLNPAPARQLSDDLLALVDILTPNESECEMITGISINGPEDAKRAVEFLNSKGVAQVIITMGRRGAVYNSASGIRHKKAAPVEAVDTTAAGDSFTGAIAVSLSQGKTLDEAVDFATIVGALTVTRKGAQPSLPTMQDVREFIDRVVHHPSE